MEFSAEQLAKWVAESTDVHVGSFYVIFFRLFGLEMLLCYNISLLLNLRVRVFLKSAVSISIIIFSVYSFCHDFDSGQMWNHIRGSPSYYAHRNPQTGQVSYIHGSSQAQFAAETHIVIVLNALYVAGMILLNEKAIEVKEIGKLRYGYCCCGGDGKGSGGDVGGGDGGGIGGVGVGVRGDGDGFGGGVGNDVGDVGVDGGGFLGGDGVGDGVGGGIGDGGGVRVGGDCGCFGGDGDGVGGGVGVRGNGDGSGSGGDSVCGDGGVGVIGEGSSGGGGAYGVGSCPVSI
ncbi:unnamed protein product, partial [Porites lobata]